MNNLIWAQIWNFDSLVLFLRFLSNQTELARTRMRYVVNCLFVYDFYVEEYIIVNWIQSSNLLCIFVILFFFKWSKLQKKKIIDLTRAKSLF